MESSSVNEIKEDANKQQNPEIFFALIEKVGSMGKYQVLLMVALSILTLLTGGFNLMTPFLFYQDSYQCNQLSARNCLDMVCKLQPHDRTPYIPEPTIISFANDFGDYRCPQQMSTLDLVKSIMYLGSFLSFFFTSVVGDLISGRKLLIGGILLHIISLVVLLNAWNIWIGAIALFFAMFGIMLSYGLSYVFVTELVAEHRRQTFKILVAALFSIGALTNVLEFFILPNYKYIVIIFFLVPTAILGLAFTLFFKDTPASLLTKSTPQKAHKSLAYMAKINNKQFDMTVDQLQQLQISYKRDFTRQSKQSSQRFSLVDLFRYPSLRSMTLMLIFVDITFTLQYYTPTLMLNQFNFGIYISGLGIQSAQVFAGIISYFTIYKVKRKVQNYISFTIIMVCSIVLIFIWDQDAPEVTDISSNIVTLLFIFVIEMTVSNSFNYYMVYLNQLYPTQVRIIGIGLVKTFGSITVMISSQIINACITSGFKIMFLFAALAGISIILSCFLPQTFGKRPPQVIVQFKQKQYRDDTKDSLIEDNVS